MSIKSRWVFCLLSLSFLITTLIYFYPTEEKGVTAVATQTKPQITTYFHHEEKKDKDIIVSRAANKQELKKSPAMQAEVLSHPNQKFRGKYLLTGNSFDQYSDTDVELFMLNRPDPKWEKKLAHELLRFQPEGVKTIIKHERDIILVYNNQGRYLEQVIVTYLNSNGKSYSFRATVDSASGQVLKTWDRTQYEDWGKRPMQFTQFTDSN